jgi:hypothetical protein
VSEPLDAAPPDCAVHLVSAAFQPTHATPAGKVRVEGDYLHTLAKVSVERPNAAAWSGTFSGPREAFFDFLRRHVCASSRVYVLQPEGNKDPTKGPVSMAVFEMTPDEKGDVETICNANVRAPGADAGQVDQRDHAMMQWIEDALTTTKWDAWRRSFAHDRGDLITQGRDAAALYHARGDNIAAAAASLGLSPCPIAIDWKKR